jgi:hypothetical protein
VLGPNSLGGALNLVTRSGGGPTAGDLSVRVGSFGAYAAEGSWAGDTGGWRYYGGGSFERENGWRRVTGAERMGGLLNLSRGSATRGARVQIFGGRSYAETAGSLPFSVFEREPEANLTSGDLEDLR